MIGCQEKLRKINDNFLIYRSSQQRCCIKKIALKNFAKFTGKHLHQGLFFNKFAGLRSATLFKKRLCHKCFPVNLAKSLRVPFLQTTSGRLLLRINGNLPNSLLNHTDDQLTVFSSNPNITKKII